MMMEEKRLKRESFTKFPKNEKGQKSQNSLEMQMTAKTFLLSLKLLLFLDGELSEFVVSWKKKKWIKMEIDTFLRFCRRWKG